MSRTEFLQSAQAGFQDSTGSPLSAGKLFTYVAGTTTPKTTWADYARATPNTNPVILDSQGRAPIFGDGAYKFDLQTAANVPQQVIDNCFLGIPDGAEVHGGTSTGAANTFEVTVAPALFAYAPGQLFSFIAHQTNTGNSTINVNGLGVRTLLTAGVAQVYPGAVQSGAICYCLVTNTTVQLLNPSRLTQTYAPSITPSSGGTLSTFSNAINYDYDGAFCNLSLFSTFTVVASPIPTIRITLPIAATSTSELHTGAFCNAGAGNRSAIVSQVSTSQIEVTEYAATSFSVGTSRSVGLKLRYRWI